VAQLIASAKAHYDQAQTDLTKGDFVGYAQEIKTVGDILRQLAALQPASPSPSASPKASPSASP
jgi:NAD(P)H-dependent flavin oxidoreductase YrpB (nitropropane dioxygenase family)